MCFVLSGQVDQERYSSFGLTPEANLDDEDGVPTSFAATELNDTIGTTIAELVSEAAS